MPGIECANSAPAEIEKVSPDPDCKNNQIGGDGDKNQKTEGEIADISTEET